METYFESALLGASQGRLQRFHRFSESSPHNFYDPFSYKTDPALWTVETFSRILNHCPDEPAEFYTYSASTAVRGALLAAGFFVAQGLGTGPKSETTVAFTSASGSKDHPLSPQLLRHSWLKRWRRSGAKFPANIGDEDKPHFERLIESHPQFALKES